jgi:hypothetical protein
MPRKIRIGYNFTRPEIYLYLHILQDLSIEYLLIRLGNRPPGPDPQAEWADTWWAPLSFSLSPASRVLMVPNLVSSPRLPAK